MSRVERVREWFGVGEGREEKGEMPWVEAPGAGEILLVMGASGGGKSMLLREMQFRNPLVEWVDLASVVLGDCAVVDCFPEGMELEEVLGALGRVGLGEVWTYLRRPGELSEGQRWRLRMALGLLSPRNSKSETRMTNEIRRPNARRVLAGDEFGAVLDRVSAMVVAQCLRRAITVESGWGAVVATSHEDLVGALGADRVVRCDFGRVTIGRREAEVGTADERG